MQDTSTVDIALAVAVPVLVALLAFGLKSWWDYTQARKLEEREAGVELYGLAFYVVLEVWAWYEWHEGDAPRQWGHEEHYQFRHALHPFLLRFTMARARIDRVGKPQNVAYADALAVALRLEPADLPMRTDQEVWERIKAWANCVGEASGPLRLALTGRVISFDASDEDGSEGSPSTSEEAT